MNRLPSPIYKTPELISKKVQMHAWISSYPLVKIFS